MFIPPIKMVIRGMVYHYYYTNITWEIAQLCVGLGLPGPAWAAWQAWCWTELSMLFAMQAAAEIEHPTALAAILLSLCLSCT